MSEIDLYEAMSTLRAVRRLRTDPIPEDVLGRVLQAATWAPSGGNVQPWRVIVVQDEAKRQARPWELGKAADCSAPIGPLRPAGVIGHPRSGAITLDVGYRLYLF